MDTAIWGKTKPASFKVDGRPAVVFPVWNNVEGSHGIRVVKRAVPFLDGEQLDETGTTGGEWSTAIPFWNDFMSEPGIGQSPVLYPDRLELLESILALRKTGTLHLPWRRNIRCKAVSWKRVATTDKLDGEELAVQWCEDNESKLENPSESAGIRVSLQSEVQQAVFAAEKEGMWGGGWEQLTTIASQLEATLAAPSEFREDVQHKANRMIRCCDSILTSFSSRAPGRDGMSKPEGSRARRHVLRLKWFAERAEEESRASRGRIQTRRTSRDGSVWSAAMEWQVDPFEILELNPNIPDPNDIPAGYPLLVQVV